MKIILLGAPGSGKGTQAIKIKEHYNLPHISTGDIFRDNIKRKTPVGMKIKEIIDGGNLAPDELTIEIVKQRLEEKDCQNGYLLDGFPRNLIQARALEQFASPDLVLEIDIPIEKLERRLSGRRTCIECGNSFHVDFLNGSDVCPHCNGKLYVRKDDSLESVKERIKVYKSQTMPLNEYYLDLNKLVKVDGDKEIDKVFEEIKKVLG